MLLKKAQEKNKSENSPDFQYKVRGSTFSLNSKAFTQGSKKVRKES